MSSGPVVGFGLVRPIFWPGIPSIAGVWPWDLFGGGTELVVMFFAVLLRNTRPAATTRDVILMGVNILPRGVPPHGLGGVRFSTSPNLAEDYGCFDVPVAFPKTVAGVLCGNSGGVPHMQNTGKTEAISVVWQRQVPFIAIAQTVKLHWFNLIPSP